MKCQMQKNFRFVKLKSFSLFKFIVLQQSKYKDISPSLLDQSSIYDIEYLLKWVSCFIPQLFQDFWSVLVMNTFCCLATVSHSNPSPSNAPKDIKKISTGIDALDKVLLCDFRNL